jgi:hypothetical protein
MVAGWACRRLLARDGNNIAGSGSSSCCGYFHPKKGSSRRYNGRLRRVVEVTLLTGVEYLKYLE